MTNVDSGTISVIETASNTVTATVGGLTLPRAVAFSPDGRHAYVPNFGSNKIAVIDTASLAVMAAVPIGQEPGGVAITPDGHNAYILSNTDPGKVSVIDTVHDRVTTRIAVPDGPLAVAITPDGHRAYSANAAASVSVIDVDRNRVIETIPCGQDAGCGDQPRRATRLRNRHGGSGDGPRHRKRHSCGINPHPGVLRRCGGHS